MASRAEKSAYVYWSIGHISEILHVLFYQVRQRHLMISNKRIELSDLRAGARYLRTKRRGCPTLKSLLLFTSAPFISSSNLIHSAQSTAILKYGAN